MDPTRTDRDTKAPAQLARLLDGLSRSQQLKEAHLLERWDSRAEATDRDVFKIRRFLKDMFTNDSVLTAASASSSSTLLTESDDQLRKQGMLKICKKHPEGLHSWLT